MSLKIWKISGKSHVCVPWLSRGPDRAGPKITRVGVSASGSQWWGEPPCVSNSELKTTLREFFIRVINIVVIFIDITINDQHQHVSNSELKISFSSKLSPSSSTLPTRTSLPSTSACEQLRAQTTLCEFNISVLRILGSSSNMEHQTTLHEFPPRCYKHHMFVISSNLDSFCYIFWRRKTGLDLNYLTQERLFSYLSLMSPSVTNTPKRGKCINFSNMLFCCKTTFVANLCTILWPISRPENGLANTKQ